MLDVGYGFGDQDLLWVEECDVKHIVGLNIVPAQVDTTARARVAAARLEARIDLRCGSATEMGLADASVNTVTALECAFHFITRDRFLSRRRF